jgi:glycosyltransferase involved in cell wall biosynthesis
MLTPYLPYPPSSGGQIRSYNLIKELSKKHQITLYSLIKYDYEKKYVKELEKFCHKVKIFKRPEKPWTLGNILRTGFSPLPFLAILNFSNEEKDALAKLLEKEKFDIIHAETFYVSPHIPKVSTPLVLVDQTIEYQVYEHFVKNFKLWPLKPLLWIDVLKIKYWETYYWKKAIKVIAVSEKDAEVMKMYVPKNKVEIVPNPVGEDLMKKVPLHYSKKILFMGNYNWMQNVEAAEILVKLIFPEIKKRIPDASLVIAGQNIEKVSHLKSENIEMVGLAIDDIKGVVKAYHTSGILLAPLYGPAGGRVKIIGGMAAMLPVVTTNIGIQGIDAVNGKSALFGKTPEELVKLAVKLLTDKNLYKKIAREARELAEKKYSYQSIAKKLDAVYKEAANEKT